MPDKYADRITHELQAMLYRLDKLSQATAGATGQNDLLPQLFQELETSVEELRVANEELRVQSEQLLLSRRDLEAAEARYRDLFEFAPDGYLVTDTNGVIREANHAAAELLGVSTGRLLNKPLALFIAEDERQAFRQDLDRLVESGGRREWERMVQPHRLPPFPASLTVAVVREGGEEPAALRWMLRDVSASRRAEEERAQLIREQAARAAAEAAQQRLAFLAEASALLASSLDYETTLERLAHLAVPDLADWCSVHILDASDDVLRQVAVAHTDPAKVELARELRRRYPLKPGDDHPITRALRSGAPQWVARITEEMLQAATRDAEHLRMVRELGLTAIICVPLVARERKLGVLSLAASRAEHAFSAEDFALAQDLARHAAVAVDNARLYRLAQEEIAERERTEAALRESEERFRLLVEGAKDYAMFLMDTERRVVHWSAGAEQLFGYREEEMLDRSDDLIFTAEDRERGAPDQEVATAIERGSAEDMRWHVRRDGSLFWTDGVLTCLYDDSGNRRGFAKILRDATERKEAEERLRLALEKERHIADSLQRAMLPQIAVDAFPGLSVAPRYEAALAEARVGGDFYDAFALSDGRVVLVVGDASGKGLQAAARTAEVKYALRAFLRMDPDLDLPRALTRLNEFLCDIERLDKQQVSEAFISLALVVVDAAGGTACCATAGAEPTLLLRASGADEEVQGAGLPLGVLRASEYRASEVRLAPGDTLLMVTDGITEARRGGEFLGYEGMKRLAREALALGSIPDAAEAVLEGAKSFACGALHDDACLFIARWEGSWQ